MGRGCTQQPPARLICTGRSCTQQPGAALGLAKGGRELDAGGEGRRPVPLDLYGAWLLAAAGAAPGLAKGGYESASRSYEVGT